MNPRGGLDGREDPGKLLNIKSSLVKIGTEAGLTDIGNRSFAGE